MVSKARQWALFLTRVAARAYLKASRSSMGMWRRASMASMSSVIDTGRPAARSSTMNPVRTSSNVLAPLGDRQFLGRLGYVALVLEQDVQGGGGLLDPDVVDAQQHEG